MNRRDFLKLTFSAIGAAAFASWGFFNTKHKSFPGKLLGPSMGLGHKVRDQHIFAEPSKILKTKVVIVGGGMSALSAANYFVKHGMRDFKLLEMEKLLGGNSQFGQNKVSAYPWGAHYVPLPGPDAKYVRELFEELGVIEGYNEKGLPIYNELYLCHAPEERLFKEGRWQEGLVPHHGVNAEDKREIEKFFKLVHALKESKGKDGKFAFTIPLAFSSQDEKFLALDKLSMADWMQREGFVSKPLNWYVNYCCRDDYGGTAERVSAWAGLHYFASRHGEAANAESSTVLTWPEGNGWLVKKLKEPIEEQTQTNSVVYKIEVKDKGAAVYFYNQLTHESLCYECEQVIFAAPRFMAAHIISGLQSERPAYLNELHYGPWMVANITLNSLPHDGPSGAALAWDNVSYHGQSLGYVVSTHQDVKVYEGKTVLTYYLPLTQEEPSKERMKILNKKHADWVKAIVAELKKMHPTVERQIENIDVWLWGHGMIRPSVGYLWGTARQEMQKSFGPIHFAHSDMSGVSIFEEAQFQGIEAAKRVIG